MGGVPTLIFMIYRPHSFANNPHLCSGGSYSRKKMGQFLNRRPPEAKGGLKKRSQDIFVALTHLICCYILRRFGGLQRPPAASTRLLAASIDRVNVKKKFLRTF